MKTFLSLFTALPLLLAPTLAIPPSPHHKAIFPHPTQQWQHPKRRSDSTTNVKEAFFNQLIDHNNPSLGTFPQRYFYSTPYYHFTSSSSSVPSPIILLGPGGTGMDDSKFWLQDNYTIAGMLAYRMGGAMVMLEDRYYGNSVPVKGGLGTDKLGLLTQEQMMKDRVYFARNVELPFVKGKGAASPERVPWVNVGCSGGASRAIFTERELGGTFWATWASSAPVEGIQDFWRYFDAAKKAVARNCTADVERVVEHLDEVLAKGPAKEIQKIKDMFGAGDVKENADFMNLLAFGPQRYQDASLHTHEMWTFCDYIENAVNQTDPTKIPGPQGVGLEKALAGYARWVKEYFLKGDGSCGGGGASCWNLLDPKSSAYAKRSTTSTETYASWQERWIWCNEGAQQWQTGSPKGTPTLISRLINVDYYLKLCANNFPPGPKGETYGIAKGVTVEDYNAKHGGWSDPTFKMKHVVAVTGAFDPWTAASYASPQRPGGFLGNNTRIKLFMNPKGNHCTDTFREAGRIWPEVAAVQEEGIQQMIKWIAEFPKQKA